MNVLNVTIIPSFFPDAALVLWRLQIQNYGRENNQTDDQ